MNASAMTITSDIWKFSPNARALGCNTVTYHGQTSQPYSSTLMHGCKDFPTSILTYLAETGVNVFNSGVKWSQLPMQF